MNQLFLADFQNNTEQEIRDHLVSVYEGTKEQVDKFDILIALESEDSYEGWSFFLLRDKETGEYYENHASHCSCFGYEGQFRPEKTTLEYVKSGRFAARAWGSSSEEEAQIRELIAAL